MARFGALSQYFDSAGAPLINGLLYFYESGTTTPKNTYADVNLTIPNTNPVVLTAAGRQPNIFFNGAAKVILADEDDVVIETRDPVGLTDIGIQLQPWVQTFRYPLNALVEFEGKYYKSLANNNLANEPTAGSAWWDQLFFLTVWNSNVTYALEDLVIQDGVLYTSQQANNLNHDPALGDAAWWLPPTDITVADQATMETATNNDEMVTPLATKWHPGVAKCWIKANGAGTSISASHNITSISDDGTGTVTITIATDFSSGNYAIAATLLSGGLSFTHVSSQAAGSFRINAYDAAGNLSDPTDYFASAFGDQV